MTEYLREHRKGIIGSLIFHAILIVLMFFFGFFTKLPLPGEEGILVSFGNSQTGFGAEQPASRRIEPEPTRIEPRQEIVPSTPPPPPPVQAQPARQEVMTQDFEESAAIEAARRKKQEEDRQRQQQIDAERQRQAAEAERQRQQELERRRLEEEARKKQEEEARRIAEIDSRTRDAFGRTNTGASTGSGTGQSQGTTFPGGNQGSPTGDPNAGATGPGGSGGGTQGSGISYSLSGRTATTTPKPNYPGSEEGVVVVTITVDKNGNVTQATAGARGSTTMNPDLLNAARNAALQAKFNVDNNAPAFQTGTITYRFRLGQ
jgi:TonB family protein